MNVFGIFITLGFKNGKEALGLLKQMRKSGCKEIKLTNLSKDSFSVNCNHPNTGKKISLLFDFLKNRQYETLEFSTKALLPWDRRCKGTITEIGNLNTGRHLRTIEHTNTFNNGVKTAEKTVINNHVTGTTLERRINSDGQIEYYRQRKGEQMEKLFS